MQAYEESEMAVSRKIDYTKKLSKDDRDWLLTNGRTVEVERNDAEFGVSSDTTEMDREARDARISELQAELATLQQQNAVEDNPNLAQGGLAGIVGGVKDNTVVDGEVPAGAPVTEGDNYETLKVPELQAEIAERNKEREEAGLETLAVNGTKAQLIERLRRDDQEAAEADNA